MKIFALLIRMFPVASHRIPGHTIDVILIARVWRGPVDRAIMAVLPPFNFLTLHYVYFIATCLVGSVIFYLSSTPWRSVAYVDAIFLCVSAMTGAGLNTVRACSCCFALT